MAILSRCELTHLHEGVAYGGDDEHHQGQPPEQREGPSFSARRLRPRNDNR